MSTRSKSFVRVFFLSLFYSFRWIYLTSQITNERQKMIEFKFWNFLFIIQWLEHEHTEYNSPIHYEWKKRKPFFFRCMRKVDVHKLACILIYIVSGFLFRLLYYPWIVGKSFYSHFTTIQDELPKKKLSKWKFQSRSTFVRQIWSVPSNVFSSPLDISIF